MLTLSKSFKLVSCFLLFVKLLVKAVNSLDGIDRYRNIRAISLKFLLFCCFDFDPKISTKCIYLVYYLFYFYLNCRMVQEFWIPFITNDSFWNFLSFLLSFLVVHEYLSRNWHCQDSFWMLRYHCFGLIGEFDSNLYFQNP